ncbi:hypothetical protein [Cohnella boryungensis]|uniref:Uncharacterized protein n=1 Tax=Cohnella boryungensis TaxID=768479 RepID=A0ABV8SDC4_9BACL
MVKLETKGRKGGAAWGAAAIAIAATWSASIELWTITLLCWGIVGLTWTLARKIRGEISFREAGYSIVGLILAAACLQGAAYLVEEGSSHVQTAPKYALVYCIGLFLVIAAGLAVWLLASAIPSAVAGMGSSPGRILGKAWRITSRNRRIWNSAAVSGSLHVGAIMAGSSGNVPAGLTLGLIAALAQANLMVVASSVESAISVTEKRKASPRGWTILRNAFLIAHTVLLLLYVIFYGLIGDWEWATGWRLFLLIPYVWLSGAVIALIAWLIGRVKVIYYAVLLLLVLVCAGLTGLIVALLGDLIVH